MPERTYPARLFVETTTRCNLRCPMCVKTALGSDIPEQDLPFAVFERLAPLFPHLEALLLNGLGEPLLHPDLARMAALARASMPAKGVIGFQTNGLLLDEGNALELARAGVDTICVSVDALRPCGGDLHHGVDAHGQLDRAFAHLRRAREAAGRPLRIGIEFVLMRDTAAGLPEVLAWAGARGADYAIVTHLLPHSAQTAEQELFNPNTDEAARLFARWRAEAERRGVDLAAAPFVGWKFNRSPEQQRLLNLLREMHADARSRGMSLHLESLLAWEGRDMGWLDEVFARARRVARELNMALDLPPLMARHERECGFVEHGSMFVTPGGDVHPCHFLWHRQACWMHGQAKRMAPVSFGNVRENDPLDLWNAPPFAAFRGEVLENAYPYCTNCSFVPCPDITGQVDDFDRDCYGSTVPCGHCVWCMGGVRCLELPPV